MRKKSTLFTVDAMILLVFTDRQQAANANSWWNLNIEELRPVNDPDAATTKNLALQNLSAAVITTEPSRYVRLHAVLSGSGLLA